ncbi:MAG: hypothetical protein ABIG71_00360 [Candidatus Uhrbacteria bacterium]
MSFNDDALLDDMDGDETPSIKDDVSVDDDLDTDDDDEDEDADDE